MISVFLGDTFSLDDAQFLGRPIANRALVRAVFTCDYIDKIITVGDPQLYQTLGMHEVVARKLVMINSVSQLLILFRDTPPTAILCSSLGLKYSQLVHFRNICGLDCPVYGFTHTLSYQDEMGAYYRMFCAGIRARDGILCTSRTAIDVVGRQLDAIASTLSFSPQCPRLIHFPLACDMPDRGNGPARADDCLQVLFLGRLNWRSKADLLVIPRIADRLPTGHRLRFVIAGASNNPQYTQLLQEQCAGRPIQIMQDITDEQKIRLYQESHVLFSPSDNYQETFGLSIIEAKYYGCVPVVTDFDGYRDLVRDGVDGRLVRTIAARIPEGLWRAQVLMPDNIYHGWWAAGVAIDVADTAEHLFALSQDRAALRAMSVAAAASATSYSVASTARRFGVLMADALAQPATADTEPPSNPFHIDYAYMFATYPSAFWGSQSIVVTDQGAQFLQAPDLSAVPQLSLLADVITLSQVVEAMHAARNSRAVTDLLSAGIEPVILSVLLKNGLIRIAVQ
jgi:glycosyltransferase involved in cell wall biosynthesis